MSISCNSVKMTDKNGDLNFINQAPTQWQYIPSKPVT
jgi:hypothetical protein